MEGLEIYNNKFIQLVLIEGFGDGFQILAPLFLKSLWWTSNNSNLESFEILPPNPLQMHPSNSFILNSEYFLIQNINRFKRVKENVRRNQSIIINTRVRYTYNACQRMREADPNRDKLELPTNHYI